MSLVGAVNSYHRYVIIKGSARCEIFLLKNGLIQSEFFKTFRISKMKILTTRVIIPVLRPDQGIA